MNLNLNSILLKLIEKDFVQAELITFLPLEEEFWRQKSGMTWFKKG